MSEPIRHLYVHVPFCGRRCSYCDFSIAVRKEVPATEFCTSVIGELKRRSDRGQLANLETVYFGGGTPSKLGGAGVAGLLAGLRAAGVVFGEGAGAPGIGVGSIAGSGTEVTIEVNPEDLTQKAAEAWLAAGVNRLSLGVQSFSPEALTWMHRTHSAGQAREAVRVARAAGFSNLSIDLIYALPSRVHRSWDDDLTAAIELDPEHLSVYGLTVEPRTPLGKWTARGAELPQTDDRAADEFLEGHERLTSAGFEHYEVSSYAKPGRRSRHNSAYWRRVPYLGLGPSAHSYDGQSRRWNIAALAAWEQAVAAGVDPVAGTEQLTAEQNAAEERYLALRADTGARLSGADLGAARSWVAAGWATEDSGLVRLTAEGWLRLDALVGAISR